MGTGLDKLGRLIEEGDLIAFGEYGYSIGIGVVYNVNGYTIRFKAYSNVFMRSNGLFGNINMDDLKSPPKGWRGWTHLTNTPNRILILNKKVKFK